MRQLMLICFVFAVLSTLVGGAFLLEGFANRDILLGFVGFAQLSLAVDFWDMLLHMAIESFNRTDAE
jgi:hypothetical protein